jgi:hypothetical protein
VITGFNSIYNYPDEAGHFPEYLPVFEQKNVFFIATHIIPWLLHHRSDAIIAADYPIFIASAYYRYWFFQDLLPP